MIFLFLIVCLFSATWCSLTSIKLLLLKYTEAEVQKKYFSMLFLIPICIWLANEEDVVDIVPLALSIYYLILLNNMQTKRSIFVFSISAFITIFFISFCVKKSHIASWILWILINEGIRRLLFFIFNIEAFQNRERIRPIKFFTRKFKIVF